MTETTDASAGARRRIPARAVIAVLVLAAVALMAWWLSRPGEREESFTGYVVSDNIYMTSPVAGTISSVAVKRGQRVAVGDALFRVEPTVRAAEAEQAAAQIAAQRAQVAQQQSGLARVRADLAAAQADAERFGAELRRLNGAQRDKPGSVAQLDIEQARTEHDAALRRRDAVRTDLDAATAAIAAARANVVGAEAGLVSARQELTELSPPSPVAGRIEEVMFKAGESVTPNVPVISIVPDSEVKLRFYVPQTLVNGYRPGRKVAISCDGCAAGMTAVVDFVATEPEYTPPVIYSLETRDKLVFLVEAVPSNPRALIRGQPINVAFTAGARPAR